MHFCFCLALIFGCVCTKMLHFLGGSGPRPPAGASPPGPYWMGTSVPSHDMPPILFPGSSPALCLCLQLRDILLNDFSNRSSNTQLSITSSLEVGTPYNVLNVLHLEQIKVFNMPENSIDLSTLIIHITFLLCAFLIFMTSQSFQKSMTIYTINPQYHDGIFCPPTSSPIIIIIHHHLQHIPQYQKILITIS